MMRFMVCGLALGVILVSVEATGQGTPPLLPVSEEVSLAESAAPSSITRDAAIYLLRADGYVLHRPGRNGFTCLVERSHPASIEPICLDAAGSRAVLPRILDVATLRATGADSLAIARAIAEGYREGRYIPPTAGIAYMLSPGTRFFNPTTGVVEAGHPHLMFYAPYLRNADIASPGETALPDRCTPFVIQEGTPEAYIIVLMADCAGYPESAHGQ